MLKTVKVGDTSLQYTVVSQTDELSVGSNTVNVLPTSRKRKSRHRKTVILVLITMVMGCGIVIAAVLVPILIASKLVDSLPESAKLKTFAISANSIQGFRKHSEHGQKFVELLPVNEAAIDASIEFQDEFPPAPWSIEGKWVFNTDAPRTYPHTEVTTSIIPSNDRTFNSNSSGDHNYHRNKTDNGTPRMAPSENQFSAEEKTSDWITMSIHILNNIFASLVSKLIS